MHLQASDLVLEPTKRWHLQQEEEGDNSLSPCWWFFVHVLKEGSCITQGVTGWIMGGVTLTADHYWQLCKDENWNTYHYLNNATAANWKDVVGIHLTNEFTQIADGGFQWNQISLFAPDLLSSFRSCWDTSCEYKVDLPNSMSDLNGHLYLSGIWLGVHLRMDTKKKCVEQRLDYMLKIYSPF